MKEIIKSLEKRFKSYGHFTISIVKDGKVLSTVTTNTMAIDAAFDKYYDDNDNSDSYYESREEAQIALVDEIISANE
jgi:hypothetical protein